MALKSLQTETNHEEKKGANPMSSIYTQLTEADLQLEKDLSALIPTTPAPSYIKPKLTGIKLAILASFTVGIAAMMGVVYVYESLLLEAKQRKALESSHAALSERSVALESSVDEQKNLVIQLRDRVTQSQRKDDAVRNEIRYEIQKHQKQLSDLQNKLQTFETKTVPVPTSVQTPTVVSSATAQVVAPVVESKTASANSSVPGPIMTPTVGKQRVLTVNRQFKFVVINYGSQDGAKIGDTFTIQREGKQIGSVQIEKLYDNFAAATITEENQNAPIEVGDSITKAA